MFIIVFALYAVFAFFYLFFCGLLRFIELAEFLRQGLTGLVRPQDLPPFHTWKYTDDTWEWVLYHDAWQRLIYIASYASYHSNHNPGDKSLLTLAKDLNDELFGEYESLYVERKLLSADAYRTAGVIYGNVKKTRFASLSWLIFPHTSFCICVFLCGVFVYSMHVSCEKLVVMLMLWKVLVRCIVYGNDL